MLNDFLVMVGKNIVYNMGEKRNWQGRLAKDERAKCLTIRTPTNSHPMLGSYEQESPWSQANTVVLKEGVAYIVPSREAA